MEMKKVFGVLVLLFALTLFVQNASATLVSSYYDGTVYYDEAWGDGYLRGHIDFAVYDNPDEYEFVTGFEAPGSGDYIYAYQIFNDDVFSDEAVAYFAILGIDGDAIDLSSIDAEDDLSGGIEPTPNHGYYIDEPPEEEMRVVWEFRNGFIYKDNHSWVLVLSSDQDYVLGDYEIRGSQDDDIVIPDVPEPSVIALLGFGSTILFTRRRKSA